MTSYLERKAARVEHFNRFVKGWKQRPCTACAGSGRYDHNGSPPCGACNGTGRERYKPPVGLEPGKENQDDPLLQPRRLGGHKA